MAPIRVEAAPRLSDPLGLLIKIGNSPYIRSDVKGLIKYIAVRNRNK